MPRVKALGIKLGGAWHVSAIVGNLQGYFSENTYKMYMYMYMYFSFKDACTHAVTLDLFQTYKLGMRATNSERSIVATEQLTQHYWSTT